MLREIPEPRPAQDDGRVEQQDLARPPAPRTPRARRRRRRAGPRGGRGARRRARRPPSAARRRPPRPPRPRRTARPCRRTGGTWRPASRPRPPRSPACSRPRSRARRSACGRPRPAPPGWRRCARPACGAGRPCGAAGYRQTARKTGRGDPAARDPRAPRVAAVRRPWGAAAARARPGRDAGNRGGHRIASAGGEHDQPVPDPPVALGVIAVMSPRLRRASLVPLAVAALGLLAVAAPASAAVTVSNVTAPSDQSFIHYDGAKPTITVVGTSNGAAGDAVDLYCTNGVGTTFTTTLIKAAVPVAAGGRLHLLGRPHRHERRAPASSGRSRRPPPARAGHEPHDLHRAARVPRARSRPTAATWGSTTTTSSTRRPRAGWTTTRWAAAGWTTRSSTTPPRWPRATRSSTATSTSRTATARRPPPRARSSSSTGATPTRPTRRTTSTPGPRRPPASCR